MEMQVFDFEEPLKFNVIEFEEKGNKVDLVKVEALLGGEMKEIYRQDEMGNRVAVIDPIETTKVQVTISASEKGVTIKKVKFSFVEFLVRENKLNVSAYMAGPFSDGLLNSFDERLAVTTEIILIGYINFDDKGNLVHRNGYEFLDRDIAALKEGIKQQNAKTKILMCFGNFEGEKENADKVFSTKEIRANFIKQAIDFIKKYDLDGADIDFEYPANKKQWDGYSKVLVEFKKELLKLNLPLSIALPSWGVELSAEAIKAVDEVQMMQYDLFDEKRRHAPFEVFAYGIEYFQKIGFPKEKLYPGLALYGREKDVNAEERWLSYEGICMMYDLIDANTNEMDNSYFTGKTMNRDKTFYALLKGCGGIMLFQYACDLPFENELSIFRGVSEIINGFVKIEAPKAKVEKPKAKVVETPKAKVEEPKAKVVETPKAKVETPKAKVVETPKVKVEEPKAKVVETPKVKVEEPKAKVVETPKAKVEEPKTKVVETPKVKVEEPKAKVVETPKAKVETPKAKVVETPKVKVEEPKAEQLKFNIEEPKAKVIETPKVKVEEPKAKVVEAPKVKIEELKAKVIETPKVKIEEPKAKVVETPKVKVEAPKLKAKVEAPKLKEVAQKPKIVAAAEKPKIVAAKENVKLPKTTK